MKWLFIFLFSFSNLFSYDARPPCYKALERNFFDYASVAQVMSMNRVQQGQWEPIIRQLNFREQEAEKIIQKKARLLNPNPLEYPFQPDVARDLLKQTQKEIFKRVLLESGFFDYVYIDNMFESLWDYKTPLIEKCLGPEKNDWR